MKHCFILGFGDVSLNVKRADKVIEKQGLKVLIELSVSTYSQGLLSFGKARELARIGKYEFSKLLGKRGITRHYGSEELEDDLTYAGSK